MAEESTVTRSGRLSAEELELFNRQLLTVAKTGAPLVPALKALSTDLRRGRLRDAVESLLSDLKTGKSLSEALARHSGQFPPLYTAMTDAAAASGNLLGIMEMLSHLVTSAAGLRRKVITAAVYPILVLCAAAGLLSYLSLVLLPQMANLLKACRPEDMPLPTGFPAVPLLNVSTYLAGISAGLLLGLLLVLVVIRFLPKGRRRMSALVNRLPLYGPVVRSQKAFLFSRTLSVLLKAGVPMRQAMRVVREVVPKGDMREALDGVRVELEAGQSLAQAMANQTGFPPTLVWTVSVAEARGDLPEGLYETSEFYREDAEHRSLFLVQILPTFLVVFVGLFVAAVVLPLFGGLISLIRVLTQWASF